MNFRSFSPYFLVLLAIGCQQKGPLFKLRTAEETGIAFRNDLTYDDQFNVYTYRNYYNGGGVAVGDINNDGLPDLYFTANQSANRLYLNKGNFQFEDITEQSGIAGTKAWSTGVSMADVNADGLLDIYVCNSGDIAGDNKQNELFINQGDLTFREAAEEFGLADPGFSTHASFFDYDKDGDLDVYLLNNSYQSIGSFNLKKNERPKRDSLGGDKLMRNDSGSFLDVSEQAGIYGSVIGFGLGITVGDVNGDGWEDIYVSNDFFERDYLYLNKRDGTFHECLTEQMQSISGASMGADLADINNDGFNDLFVTEMLPRDESRLKSVTTFEDWSRYQYGVQNGYYHQFTRNTFQLNNGDSTFSEIGRLAGVEASDWSWGALFFDMDNDGLRDLFIANGIYQDLTNQDYLQYVSNEEVVKSIVTNNKVDYKKLIDLIPSNPVPNQAYKNQGGLSFQFQSDAYGLGTPGFSNGAAYGDLDNDGDLDLVVNNVNMESFVYENTLSKENVHYLKLVLKGSGQNTFAVGARIWVQQGAHRFYVEVQPARGFQSSVDPRPHMGLPTGEPVTVQILWPSGEVSNLQNVSPDQTLVVEEQNAVSQTSTEPLVAGLIFRKSAETPPYNHVESDFVDFNRDRLLYHMNSTEGPIMAAGDVNGDGFSDLYIGGAKDVAGQLLMGSETGYVSANQSVFEVDKISEDAGSLFFDADQDGDLDLYVCSGGVEFSQVSTALLDRLYLNDGAGNFTKSGQSLPAGTNTVSSSTVQSADIDADGDLDLFVGERGKPLYYGVPGSGFLLLNDGKGVFAEVSQSQAPELKDVGMITDAAFADVDGDQDPDLVIVGDFMEIAIFLNDKGNFSRSSNATLSALKGWWHKLHAADLDGDGDTDFVVGNHGLNSRFRASATAPVSLYVKDFDQNGFIDPVLTQSINGKDVPFALRHNLIDQMKGLKKLFPDYESYKGVTIEKVFSEAQLKDAQKLIATTFETIVLMNLEGGEFEVRGLPIECQFSPVYAIASADFDADGDVDLLLGGNLYGAKPEVGRYDASFGNYLVNDGAGNFSVAKNGSGFKVKGEIRDLIIVKNQVIVSRNSDSLVVFNF